MTSNPLARELLLAAAAAGAGIVFGRWYFALLRRTVSLYGTGGGNLAPSALTLGRLACAVVFLGLAARVGALALLGAFGGFLLARELAVRVSRRAE